MKLYHHHLCTWFLVVQPSEPWFEIHKDDPNYPEVTNTNYHWSESLISLHFTGFFFFFFLCPNPGFVFCFSFGGGTTSLWTKAPPTHLTFNSQISVWQHTGTSGIHANAPATRLWSQTQHRKRELLFFSFTRSLWQTAMSGLVVFPWQCLHACTRVWKGFCIVKFCLHES